MRWCLGSVSARVQPWELQAAQQLVRRHPRDRGGTATIAAVNTTSIGMAGVFIPNNLRSTRNGIMTRKPLAIIAASVIIAVNCPFASAQVGSPAQGVPPVQTPPAAGVPTPQTQTGAQVPGTAPVIPARVAAGAAVVDASGLPVGTVAQVSGNTAVVDTGANKVGVPIGNFSKGPGGLILGNTKAELDAAASQAAARSRAQLQTLLVSGTDVHGVNGQVLGTIKALSADFVTVTSAK